MKKITTILLGVASAFCLTAGVVAMDNTAVAFADDENVASVVLSETKFKVSDNQQNVLLVTAIQNYANVYEVGYEFSEGYNVGENAKAETKKYYDSVTTNEKQTAADIFGAEYADAKLIVWEVAYAENITFNAYAKVGVMDGDELKIPDEEIVVESAEKGNAKYTVTFMDGETEVSKTTVYVGKTVAVPEVEAKWGYTLTWEVGGVAYDPTQGVTTDMTVNAVWTNNIETTDKTATKSFTYDIYELTNEKANDTYACLLTDMTIFDETPTALESVTLTDGENSYEAIYDFENGLLLARTAEAETETYTYVPAGEYVVTIRYNANKEVKVAMTLATKVFTEATELAAGLHTYTDATLVSLGNTYYDYDGYFVLGNDIECAGTEVVFSAPHASSVQGEINNIYTVEGQGFRGTFNGNGYAIKDANFWAGGLFGEVASGAVIKNTKFEKATVYYAWGVTTGILGVNLAAATVENCYFDVACAHYPSADGYGNGSAVLAGWTYYGAMIKNCVFNMRENGQSLPLVRNEGGTWNGVQGPYFAENVLIIYQTAEGNMIANRAGQTAMRANEFLNKTTINMTDAEVATVSPTASYAFEVKTDDAETLAIDGANVSGLQVGTANVWVEYTIGAYKVETAKVAVTVIAPVVVEINSEEDFRNISSEAGYTYRLMKNLEITGGDTAVVNTLNAILDLNGYTITYTTPSAALKPLIQTLNGTVKNGKIVATSTLNGVYGGGTLVFGGASENVGTIENVEFSIAFAGSTAYNVTWTDAFGTSLAFKNVVMNVSNTVSNPQTGLFTFGNVGTTTITAPISFENTIIIATNVPVGTWQSWGVSELTFANMPNQTNSGMYADANAFAAANYDTSSFSSEYWTINETTKLPEIIVKTAN